MSPFRCATASGLLVSALSAATPVADPGPGSPSESARSFQVAEGLVFEQVLAEPQVAQPVSLTFDRRGRLWVVEYRQYPNPAGLRMVSHDQFWRAVYDEVPEPPPKGPRGADRISIHEDTDGDGAFDHHRVFVDGLNIATSVAFGGGGVYVLNPPYLLHYADRDGDDTPDGSPAVLLSGFGLEDTHSVANSLRWGPDGWLYGCQGSTVTAHVRVHGTDGRPIAGEPIYSQGQDIWRYHPGRRVYEVFSEGGGNAFGLEIDSEGRVFSGHNGGNTRGFHYQQGAYLQKGFDKHGPLSNPHAFGYFPPMAHPDVDRFTHTFVIADGATLGSVFAGRLFGVEPLQGRVVMSAMESVGSTFKTRDIGYAVTSGDPWFRPVDIELGPDGALYVADWYDANVNHYRNHEGKIDATNGRVYRLRAAGAGGVSTRIPSADDPGFWRGALSGTNRWLSRQALREIAEGRLRFTGGKSEAVDPKAGPVGALNALWATDIAGQLDAGAVASAFRSPFPAVRLWAVRLLVDRAGEPDAASFRGILDLAAAETDPGVRAQLASSARRLPPKPSLALLKALLGHGPDAGDARQPLLVWWALETRCGDSPSSVLELASDDGFWRSELVRRHLLGRLMRRFADTGRGEDLRVAEQLFGKAPDDVCRKALAQGFEEAFQGRTLAGVPDGLLEAVSRAGGVSPVFELRRASPGAVERAMALVSDAKAPLPRRIQVLAALGEARREGVAAALLELVRADASTEVRRAALGALPAQDGAEIADGLVSMLGALPAELKDSALGVLASRPAWSARLAEAVESGRLGREVVGVDALRRLKATGGAAARLAERLAGGTGSGDAIPRKSEISRIVAVVWKEGGSPYPGKTLFLERCAGCHRLFGKGGQVGPDLTAQPRNDLASLVLNIVHPSAEVREGYEAQRVETADGRSFGGFLADQDSQTVTLRTTDGRTVVLARKEIETMERVSGSLMPEGLLEGLTDTQLRDLFAYLRSTQPLNDGR